MRWAQDLGCVGEPQIRPRPVSSRMPNGRQPAPPPASLPGPRGADGPVPSAPPPTLRSATGPPPHPTTFLSAVIEQMIKVSDKGDLSEATQVALLSQNLVLPNRLHHAYAYKFERVCPCRPSGPWRRGQRGSSRTKGRRAEGLACRGAPRVHGSPPQPSPLPLCSPFPPVASHPNKALHRSPQPACCAPQRSPWNTSPRVMPCGLLKDVGESAGARGCP